MGTHVSLEGFVAALRDIPPDQFTDDRVLETVVSNRVRTADLEPFTAWRPDRYTRNLVYRNDLFQVLVLCWNVGQASPIHDHAGQKCWMAMPQGRLEIVNYSFKHGRQVEFVDCEIVGTASDDVHADQCCSVHQITNRCSWCEPAVSLHVYSRPFDDCYIYDLATGERDLKPLHCDSYGPMAREFAPAD